jgi:precorrin-6Y C5,15-methyltransferase (decarboxylating)
MKHFIVIGLTDGRRPQFTPEVTRIIATAKVFSGGLRHHQIVADLLPEGTVWIDITVPLAQTLQAYEGQDEVVVFASGDPLFFGFANTLRREFPEARLTVFPAFNSLQTLAHRLCLPYHDMRIVSLTGRPWQGLDAALLRGEALMGVLTDKVHTPQVIAARLIEYGYTNYDMTLGECLGHETDERIRRLMLDEAARLTEVRMPNCLLLHQTAPRRRYFGIPEGEFALLDGRAKMITKRPVRLLTLSMLDLPNRHVLWDVGFCTGSVSIEAKMQHPDLQVTAFEVRPQCESILHENMRRFGVGSIQAVMGDFLQADLSTCPAPDAVFIGGHGGRLGEMVERIAARMQPGAVLVFNSVSEESREMFRQAVDRAGMRIVEEQRIAVDDFNPIIIMKATQRLE